MDEKLLLTVKEAQYRLQLGKTKLYELIQTGDIQAVKIGQARRIPLASVLKFMARLTGAAQ